jgi:hypothetical protein
MVLKVVRAKILETLELSRALPAWFPLWNRSAIPSCQRSRIILQITSAFLCYRKWGQSSRRKRAKRRLVSELGSRDSGEADIRVRIGGFVRIAFSPATSPQATRKEWGTLAASHRSALFLYFEKSAIERVGLPRDHSNQPGVRVQWVQ